MTTLEPGILLRYSTEILKNNAVAFRSLFNKIRSFELYFKCLIAMEATKTVYMTKYILLPEFHVSYDYSEIMKI